jgi:hypothetical protein
MAQINNVTKNSIEPIVIGQLFEQNATPEIIAMDSSSVIPAGSVLGRVNMSVTGTAAISTSGAGNTGNGTITMDATLPCQPGARAGVYTVYLTGATSGYVTGPDGVQIGAAFASLPSPWTKELKFVVAAGGTAFVNGDKFTITVPGIVQSNGTHTGSGVITMDATTPILPFARPGLYTINFTGAAAGYLLDPTGMQVGGAFVALPNPWLNELKFVVTGTPAANDISYIFVTAGTGKLKRFVSTAFDGSQLPCFVTNIDLDATGGDLPVGLGGGLIAAAAVNASKLIFAGGDSLQSIVPSSWWGGGQRVIDLLRDAGIEPTAMQPLSDYDN